MPHTDLRWCTIFICKACRHVFCGYYKSMWRMLCCISCTPAYSLYPGAPGSSSIHSLYTPCSTYLWISCLFLQFNVSPSMVLELLDRMTRVFKDYCGYLSEEALRKNFVLVYELIDEILVRALSSLPVKGKQGSPCLSSHRCLPTYFTWSSRCPTSSRRRTTAMCKLLTAMRCACMCTLSQCQCQRLVLALLAVSVARPRQLRPRTSLSP